MMCSEVSGEYVISRCGSTLQRTSYLDAWRFLQRLGIANYCMICLSKYISVLGFIFQHVYIRLT